MNNQRFDPQLSILKHKLHTIFTYYCCFGDRDNFNRLKAQNYRRMLEDAQLIDDVSDHSHLDLIYTSHRGSTGLSFEGFLNLLPEAIHFLHYENLQNVINTNFHALFEYIIENTDFGQCVNALRKDRFSQQCFMLLRELGPTLQRIYISYFDPFKMAQTEDAFKALSTFTREFEITPQLITVAQSYLIHTFLQEEQSTPAYKQWFTLPEAATHTDKYFHFLEYLVIVSSMGSPKIYSVRLPPVRKLATFLEIIEISKGFEKMCRTQKITLHLIPPEALVRKLDRHAEVSLPDATRQSSPVRGKSDSLNLNLSPELKNSYHALKDKFIGFCVQGETVGPRYLTHKKVIDIFKELDLGLKQNQVQLLLAQTCAKQIDFEAFMLLLQWVQDKVGSGPRSITKLFLELPLKGSYSAEQLRTSRVHLNFNREEYKQCFGMVKSVSLLFSLIFKSYCEPHKQTDSQLAFLSLPTYLKMMYDFELSPFYLSKSALIEVFKKAIRKSQDFMDEQELKDSFIIALPYVEDFKQCQMDQRLILLLEQMNESRGAHKLARKFPSECKEDYLTKLRANFPHKYSLLRQDQPSSP